MYCNKCGTQNKDTAKFCGSCGAVLENVIKEKSESNKGVNDNKKKTAYMIGALIIFIAIIVAIFLGTQKKKEKEYEGYLETAEKYIQELNYEQAEDCYLKAITIAPKELEAYVKLAQTYVEQGEFEEAEEILDKADEEGATGDKETEKEAEKVKGEIEEQKNTVSYHWIVEPTIEADDIYYVKDEGENIEDPSNISKQQVYGPYAAIKRDDAIGLIAMDGNLVVETEYKDIQYYYGRYLLRSKELISYGEYQIECDLFSWNDSYGLQMEDGLGGPGKGVFYYCNNLYNIQDDNGMFEVYIPEEAMPVLISEEKYAGYDCTGLWGQAWIDSLEKKYGIYYQGKLVSKKVYDECGSESEGLLAVCKDGKWGYVNQNGEVIIPIEYDSNWDKYCTGGMIGESTYAEFCYAASDGYIVLCKDGKWELRDIEGKVAIPSGKFEVIRPVYQGKCWVKQDGKWGVIEFEQKTEMSNDLSADELREKIEKETSREILYYAGEDFDGDNLQEAYALVATENNDITDEITCAGEVWFADEYGVKKMYDDSLYRIEPRILDFGTNKYWVLSEYYQTASVDYVWGIVGNTPCQASISGMYSDIQQIGDSNKCTFQHSAYDAMTDGSGHTYKQYYLYWDGDFHEYGGVSITKSQLKELEGATEIINKIEAQGYAIKDILYRDNGIININYQVLDSNSNATLLFEEGRVSLIKAYSMEKTDDLLESDYWGIYEEAVYPENATYPKEL